MSLEKIVKWLVLSVGAVMVINSPHTLSITEMHAPVNPRLSSPAMPGSVPEAKPKPAQKYMGWVTSKVRENKDSSYDFFFYIIPDSTNRERTIRVSSYPYDNQAYAFRNVVEYAKERRLLMEIGIKPDAGIRLDSARIVPRSEYSKILEEQRAKGKASGQPHYSLPTTGYVEFIGPVSGISKKDDGGCTALAHPYNQRVIQFDCGGFSYETLTELVSKALKQKGALRIGLDMDSKVAELQSLSTASAIEYNNYKSQQRATPKR